MWKTGGAGSNLDTFVFPFLCVCVEGFVYFLHMHVVDESPSAFSK